MTRLWAKLGSLHADLTPPKLYISNLYQTLTQADQCVIIKMCLKILGNRDSKRKLVVKNKWSEIMFEAASSFSYTCSLTKYFFNFYTFEQKASISLKLVSIDRILKKIHVNINISINSFMSQTFETRKYCENMAQIDSFW